MAVLLGVVVVGLLGLAAPAYAGGPVEGQEQELTGDDRPPDLAGELGGSLDRVLSGWDDDGPAAVLAEQPADVEAAGSLETAAGTGVTAAAVVTEVAEAPSAGDRGGGDQRAAPTGTVAGRSFTALLVLIAATLLFLAVPGRIDGRDPRRADHPGDFRRFR